MRTSGENLFVVLFVLLYPTKPNYSPSLFDFEQVHEIGRVDGCGVIGTLITRLGLYLGFGRRLMPRWSRALRFDAAHQHDKHSALWAGCWKSNLDP